MYLTAASTVGHSQELIEGKIVKNWLSVCAHALIRAQFPLEAAAVLEEIGDFRKSIQVLVESKYLGKANTIANRSALHVAETFRDLTR